MANKSSRTIEILNWQKFNERRDVKHSSWFRLEHSIANDPQFFSFDSDEKWFMIALLCLASAKNTGVLPYTDEQLAIHAKVPLEKVVSAIQKLTEINTVRIRHVSAPRSPRTRHSTDGRTDRTDGQDEHNNTHTTTFDFDSLYKKYPRKINPSEGKKRAGEVITSREDFDALAHAIERYSEYVRNKGIEERYILHFSTFIENRKDKPFVQPWRDWLDPETGNSHLPTANGGIDWSQVNLSGAL